MCLADTFRCVRKSSTRQFLLQDKVSNDNIRYVVKRHCLLQDIFSKKTLSVPTLAVDTVLVVRHFLFLSKKTLSVTKFSVFRHFQLRYCWLWDIFCFYQKRHCPLWDFLFSDICSRQTRAVVRHVQLSEMCSCPKLAVVRHSTLWDTFCDPGMAGGLKIWVGK